MPDPVNNEALDRINEMATNTEIEPDMDPITYRQIYKNAKAIANMLKDFGGDITNLTDWITNVTNDVKKINVNITNINNALGDITNPDKPGIEPSVEGKGDVRGKLPELSVIGLHALTDKINENLAPSAYQRLVTYEIKNCEIIGLSTIKGVTAKQAILQTWVPAAQNVEGVNSFQIAYVNDGLAFTRYKKSGDLNEWDEWQTGAIGGGGKPDEQISPSQPQDQEEGGWWLEPITGSPPDPSI